MFNKCCSFLLRVLHLALIHEHWAIVNSLLEEVSLNSNWIPYLDIQNDLGQVNGTHTCVFVCFVLNFDLTLVNFFAQTALHLAVIVDQSECVRALLCNGANAELQDRGGNTSLHLAVREHRTECVRELTSCSRTRPEHLNITNFEGINLGKCVCICHTACNIHC